MSPDQRSKEGREKLRDVADRGWVSEGGGGGSKIKKKEGRFERQKEKAVLIFTDSQRFLNILLLPAV